MAQEVNPLILLSGVLLYSIATGLLSPLEMTALATLTLILPFFFGYNTLKLLWRMKIMLITALLILLFGIMEGKERISAIADTARFLSLITVSAIFVLNADLLSLSSELGNLLSKVIGSLGWKISSYLMMSLSIFPIVFASAREMMDARRARLGSFFSHPVKNLSEYTIALMKLLFEKTLIFQDALYSRSFTVKGERTSYPLSAKDYILLFLFIILFTGVLVWKKMN